MKERESRELVAAAHRAGKSVAAMNASNMESAAAILGAASVLNQPVLVQVSPLQRQVQGFPYRRMVELIRSIAAELSQGEFSIHLDHAEDPAECRLALEAGFGSVMLDGAALPYSQNVAKVAEVRRMTNRVLEGELGVVGGGEAASSDIAACYTDPALVEDFVVRTGVDWLAVAIGNAHGVYRSSPQLNFQILEAIGQAVSLPLVLHGASGIPYRDLQRAMDMGVAKINFFTELDTAFREGWAASAAAGGYMMKHARSGQDAMQHKAEEILRVCGRL